VALLRFRATVAYQGGAFAGFQRLKSKGAPDGHTVQGALEKALSGLNDGHPVPVIGAGRTDAGVHATGQVIAFDLAWRHPPEALANAINARLSKQVVVRQTQLAPADFHPRYAAKSRAYTYQVYHHPPHHPLLDGLAWGVPMPLNVAAMNAAAASLVGQHDFATFGNPPRGEKGTTIRQIFVAEWQETAGFLGARMWLFHVRANAFLYRMVRTLTGALVQVGLGRMAERHIADLLAAKDRGAVGVLAPAHGLTLVDVEY
jgi:tRNA pseudouridine38-40 synthase